MKAVIVEKPGDESVLKIAEVPDPKIKPDEILIRVRAAGVNRADILQRQGFYPPPPGGGYAEKAAVHHGSAIKIPPSLSFEEAAGFPEVFLTAFLNLFMLAD